MSSTARMNSISSSMRASSPITPAASARPRACLLFCQAASRALAVAQDAAWQNKRHALGRALAAGVMGDDARIDEEMLFIRAVDDIDEAHVRLLGHLAEGGRPTLGGIALADPGLQYGLLALLGRLQSIGLVDSRAPVTP